MGRGGSRAWAASLAVLLALALCSAPACSGPEADGPEAVARTFASTARRGDVEGMLAVVERSAVERVELAAERASDQVGGRRSIDAAEMLQIVGVDRSVAVAEAAVLEQEPGRARVELTMTNSQTLQLQLVWEEPTREQQGKVRAGGWKVRIPLPEPDAAPEPDA